MRLFGPRQGDIWKLLSEDINGEFAVSEGFGTSYEVKKQFKDYTIILETYRSGKKYDPVFTRVYSGFKNPYGFKLKMFNEYFQNYFMSFFDMQDIQPNDSDFEDYIIRSNSKMITNALLNNNEFKELIKMQSDFLFEIEKKSASYNDTPIEDDFLINIKLPGIIKDNEVLKNLFEIVGLSLLQIEKCFSETNIDELDINNFNKFDVLKNSVKNVIVEKFPSEKIIDKFSKSMKTFKKKSHSSEQDNLNSEIEENSDYNDNSNESNINDIAEDVNEHIDSLETKDVINNNNEQLHIEHKNDEKDDIADNIDYWDIDTSMLEVDVSNLTVDTIELEKRLNQDQDFSNDMEKED